MKKCISSVFIVLVVCLSMVFPSFAVDTTYYRLNDDAGLLTISDQNTLVDKLDEISERQKCNIIVATVEGVDGDEVTAYADEFFEYEGFGYGEDGDGIILLIDIIDSKNRKWAIATNGYGDTAFTQDGREYIGNKITEELKKGNYLEAFLTFADLCDNFITQAKNGNPYNSSNLPKDPFNFLKYIGISLAIGFVAAFVFVTIMKRQLKSVRQKVEANDYVREGSMNVEDQQDVFLYSKVDRCEKPKNDSKDSVSHDEHGSSGSF